MKQVKPIQPIETVEVDNGLTLLNLGSQEREDPLQMETDEVEMGDYARVIEPHIGKPQVVLVDSEKDTSEILSSIDEIINAPSGATKKEAKKKEESKELRKNEGKEKRK